VLLLLLLLMVSTVVVRLPLLPVGVGDRAFSAGGDFEFIQQRMESTREDNAKV
jgi:hypothetical protein